MISKTTRGGLDDRLVELGLADLTVVVGVGLLEGGLGDLPADADDGGVDFGRAELAVAVRVGGGEHALHGRLNRLAELRRLELLVVVGVERVATRPRRVFWLSF